MTIFFQYRKKFFKWHAKAFLGIKSISATRMDWEHIARGISTNRTLVSLIVSIDKSSRVYVSTFGKSYSKRKATIMAETSMHALSALFAGCTFTSDEPVAPSLKTCPAIIFILGQPTIGQKNQLKEIIQGIRSQGISATIIMNVFPVTLPLDEAEKIKGAENRDKYLLKDASFMITYSIMISEDVSEKLNASLNALIGLIGSVYDSEHSKMKVYCEIGEKALRSFEKLLWGERSWATIVPTREFIAYFQIPSDYGIETVETPDLFVPSPETFVKENGIQIGTVLGQFNEPLYPAYLDTEIIFQHMAVWGSTGSGKSTFLKNLIVGLHNQQDIKALVFDIHNEYRSIISHLNGELGNDVLVFNPFFNPFSLNPIEIINTSGQMREIIRIETIENFISLLKQIFSIGENQEQRLRISLTSLTENNDYPVISDVVKLLEQDRVTKTKRDEDTLPLKLRKFCDGFYGNLFNKPTTTIPFDRIEKALTIFELGQLPIELRTFFVTVFLIQWWNFRMIQDKDTISPHVLVLDEFHHYDKMLIPRKILSEGRKYRQAMICSHQGPQQITDVSLLGDLIRNTNSKVIFRMILDTDNRIVMGSTGIHGQEWMDYLTHLERGEAIVSIYRIPKPFKILTEDFVPGEKIPDDALRAMNELIPERHAEVTTNNEKPLEDLKKRFLLLVSENEYPTTNEITDKLKIMRSDGYAIKNELMNNGLILVESVKTGRGRPSKVLSLTEQGYEILGLKKKGTPAHYGGTEHRMRIQEIAEMLKEAGWEVQIEYNGTDIRASKENKTIAYEIETCKEINTEQVKKNVLKDIKWADMVYLICPNATKKAQIKRVIKDLNVEKVEVLSYSEIERSFK